MKTKDKRAAENAVAVRGPTLNWIESLIPTRLPDERAYMVGWNAAVFGRPFGEAEDLLQSVHRTSGASLRAARRGFDKGSAVTKR